MKEPERAVGRHERRQQAPAGAAAVARAAAAEPRVAAVNVSPGGVPKLPVRSARVGWLGLAGDDHDDRTRHGGPFRAVCLYSIEAIERVRSEGHPIAPGAVGENLTLAGVELSTLSAGDRLAVGPEVVLEITKPANPCETIRGVFSDGRFARISIRTHPKDSRMYARVLHEGTVSAGDRVSVLPPLAGTDVHAHLLLDRIDENERAFRLLTWRAAAGAGVDVRIVDDGGLAMAAAPAIDGWAFNLALGFRQLPHLADEARRFFALHGTSGWIVAGESPWPGAVPSGALSVLAAAPDAVMPAAQAAPTTPGAVAARRAQHGPSDPSPGIRIRAIDRRDVAAAVAWQRVVIEASGFGRAAAEALLALAPGMVADHRVRLFLAEVDGTPVGGAALFAHGGVGGLESAAVLPAWRGRGIHRALLAARASSARESGLDVLAAWAEAGGRSAQNLGNLGMDALWQAGLYRWPAPGRPDRVPG